IIFSFVAVRDAAFPNGRIVGSFQASLRDAGSSSGWVPATESGGLFSGVPTGRYVSSSVGILELCS
ncbi:MAG: hypothetical protein WBW36_04035, partial [Candidatus Sulfotelmatobacter sp.]